MLSYVGPAVRNFRFAVSLANESCANKGPTPVRPLADHNQSCSDTLQIRKIFAPTISQSCPSPFCDIGINIYFEQLIILLNILLIIGSCNWLTNLKMTAWTFPIIFLLLHHCEWFILFLSPYHINMSETDSPHF